MADILYGKVSPSGKLSVSYPKEELNVPICYNSSTAQDSRAEWPFGYGQSYTSFAYSDLEMPDDVKTDEDSFTLRFRVTNTGKRDGDEIAQLYLSPAGGNLPVRPIQLQGFARVSLKAGETKTVTMKVYTEQLGYYSHKQQRQWNIVPGNFVLKLGASSQDIRLQQPLTLKGKAVIKPLRDHYFSETQVQGEKE